MSTRVARPRPVRFGSIALNREHRPEPGSPWLRAFVETGSKSGCVLASLNEMAEPGSDSLRHLGAGQRSYGGNDGVLITVSFSGAVPDGVHLQVTLLQEGAKRYQPAVLYRGT